MLRNFNAIFLNKMFFADEQSLILSNSAIYQQNPLKFSAFPTKIMGYIMTDLDFRYSIWIPCNIMTLMKC